MDVVFTGFSAAYDRGLPDLLCVHKIDMWTIWAQANALVWCVISLPEDTCSETASNLNLILTLYAAADLLPNRLTTEVRCDWQRSSTCIRLPGALG